MTASRLAYRRFAITLIGAAIALGATNAQATSIQDLVRIKGHERNVLTGMGIVVGLDGTGDSSKDSLIAARPFARLLSNLGNPVAEVEELAGANAYALVNVTMEVPPVGAREGDRFNVTVEKMYNAKSLAGGRLVVSLLRVPGPDTPDSEPYAFAEGALLVNPDNVSSATIRRGGQMLRNIRMNPIAADSSLTLVLKEQYAGYPVATTIAAAIDDEFAIDGLSNLALVEDAKNIKIRVPRADRPRPARFIATLMTIPIDPSLIQTEARIVINERAGIITITGNVEIGPVAISHRGMQLRSVQQPDDPDPVAPMGNGRWIGVDTTTNTAGATRLADLLTAFDQMNVDTDDQIAIIYELEKTGILHAEIVHE